MGITFDSENSKSSQGIAVMSAWCDLPPSDAADILLLIVSYRQWSGLSTSLNTPSGWTLQASGSGVKIFSLTGGASGSVNITFMTNPCHFQAWCIKLSGQKSTTPFSAGYSGSAIGFSHLINAGTTAPYPGAVFFGAITSPSGSGTTFEGHQFNSPDNFYAVPSWAGHDESGVNASLSVALRYAAAAAEAGGLSWSSVTAFGLSEGPISLNSGICGFWISPSQAPSAPDFTAPTTNELYAIGRTINVNWLPATDPNIAQGSLTYDIDYTLNGGLSWVDLTTTAAGVLTYDWNTTGLTPSTQVKLRGRAHNGTEYGQFAFSDVFTLLTDAAPGAPQNVLPTGIVNQSADLKITFTFNHPGDLQKTLEVQWSSNSDMSSPSTTGTITTANGYYTFTANTGILATVGTRYYRVRNQGVVDSTNGAWSAIKTIQVTAPISAPNITSPTAASPPTTGTHTATFTGTGHVKIQYRILKAGLAHYQSGEIATTGNSFTIAISFQNSTAYTLYLKRAAADGLWSTEDSETFTVSYPGPAVPAVTVTAHDAAGYIQICADNSDTPTSQQIFIDGVQLDTPALPADFVFNYAGAKSGQQISIVVRAFVSTGGFTDSVADLVTQNLAGLFLYEPTKESTTANFVAPPIVLLAETNEPELMTNSAMVRFRKRVKQVAHIARGSRRILNYSVMAPVAQISLINQLEKWVENGATICAKDNQKHKIFGKITGVVPTDWQKHLTAQLTITENDYTEVES